MVLLNNNLKENENETLKNSKDSHLKVVRNSIKKLWSLLKENSNPILAVLTLALVLVTILSIVSTYYVANVSLYLAEEARREELKSTIDLADNLIIELNDNKDKLIIIIDQGEKLKNDTAAAWQFNLFTNKLEQVKQTNFGDNEIRIQTTYYLNEYSFINSHLEEIHKASANRDLSVRLERINGAISSSRVLYEGEGPVLKIDDFINKISNFRDKKQRDLDELNEKTLEELKKI